MYYFHEYVKYFEYWIRFSPNRFTKNNQKSYGVLLHLILFSFQAIFIISFFTGPPIFNVVICIVLFLLLLLLSPIFNVVNFIVLFLLRRLRDLPLNVRLGVGGVCSPNFRGAAAGSCNFSIKRII